MQFMVIERFKDGNAAPIYRRYAAEGRLMPDGIAYVASWISADFTTCYQVMQAGDAALLQQWVAAWSDIVHFEIIPLVTEADTARALANEEGRV